MAEQKEKVMSEKEQDLTTRKGVLYWLDGMSRLKLFDTETVDICNEIATAMRVYRAYKDWKGVPDLGIALSAAERNKENGK